MDAEQREELEAMIRELEDENKALQAEYERLKKDGGDKNERGDRHDGDERDGGGVNGNGAGEEEIF